MKQFAFAAPTTVEEAVAALAAAQAPVKLLSGGTDLLYQLRSGRASAGLVLDTKRIPGMFGISRAAVGGFVIGAATPCAELGEHVELRATWPGLVEAANLIGSTQVQGRATLVGNLCNASPAADSVPALIAANATVDVAGPKGTHSVDVAEIAIAPGRTSLAKDEMIVAFRLPARPARSSDAYLRLIPRTEMDIAVVGCAVSLTLAADGTIAAARVSLGAVAATALLVADAGAALIGKKLDDATLAALAKAASAACKPIDDKRGTAAYRIQIAGVLARRAATIAYQRAEKNA